MMCCQSSLAKILLILDLGPSIDGCSTSSALDRIREEKNMVMKKHGNVRGEVRVNFLALFASKPHIFMCSALKLSGIVRANVNRRH